MHDCPWGWCVLCVLTSLVLNSISIEFPLVLMMDNSGVHSDPACRRHSPHRLGWIRLGCTSTLQGERTEKFRPPRVPGFSAGISIEIPLVLNLMQFRIAMPSSKNQVTFGTDVLLVLYASGQREFQYMIESTADLSFAAS